MLDPSGKAMLDEDTLEIEQLKPFDLKEFEDLINPDDKKITIDTYYRIIWKFYAAFRYQIYQKIKNYMSENAPKMSMLDNSFVIDEETVLEMTQELNHEQIYKEVFSLFGVRWNKEIDDIMLTMRKMDFHF